MELASDRRIRPYTRWRPNRSRCTQKVSIHDSTVGSESSCIGCRSDDEFFPRILDIYLTLLCWYWTRGCQSSCTRSNQFILSPFSWRSSWDGICPIWWRWDISTLWESCWDCWDRTKRSGYRHQWYICAHARWIHVCSEARYTTWSYTR